MIFNIVELLAKSELWLFLCGASLIILPAIGIMIVHKDI